MCVDVCVAVIPHRGVGVGVVGFVPTGGAGDGLLNIKPWAPLEVPERFVDGEAEDTGFVGRPYQARMFAPPSLSEANVDAAANITTGLATLQTWYTTFRTNLGTAGIDPVVIHEPSLGLVPTAISTFTVKSRLGTIGRRLRR